MKRLQHHVREKDFWTEAVMFVNKDDNIHAKYLEARLISIASDMQRYELDNGKIQIIPSLSRADKDSMEEIIPDMRLILSVLGHPILEPLVQAPAYQTETTEPPALNINPILECEFEFEGPTFSARGRVTDEGFLVRAGSTAAAEFGIGNPGYLRIREKLLSDGSLVRAGDRLEFKRDFVANSSSQAAAVVAGGNRSGPGHGRAGGEH